MNKQIKYLTLATISILIFSACQEEIKGPSNIPSETSLKQFEDRFKLLMEVINVSDYSYAIVTNKEVIASVENGINQDAKVPIDELSNLLFTASALRFTESGQLKVSEPIESQGTLKELLSFTNQHPDKRTENFTLVQKKIESISGEDIGQTISTLADDLDMSGTSIKDGIVYATIQDLFKLSQALDNQKIFESTDTHELMVRPVYLENGERMPTGLGCYINISDDGKIVWSAGQSNEYATLMLKSMSDSLSLIMVAKSGVLNQPLKSEFGDLLASPIYHTFKQFVLTPDSTRAPINFFNDPEAVKNEILISIDSGKRDQAYFELLSYMRLFKASGNEEEFTRLATIYTDIFQMDPDFNTLLSPPKASITRVMDYMQYQRPFTVGSENDPLKIFATAEYDKQMRLNPWEYDLVDMYFDISHERASNFDTRDDRQYRFHYDWDKSTGNAPTLEGFVIKQSEPSSTGYNLEVLIPRETLFNTDTINFIEGMQFGFDLILSDNDGNSQEGLLTWRSDKGTTPWTNTSTYGTLALVKSASIKSDTIYFAPKSKGNIILDGKNTGEWSGVPVYMPEKEFRQENIDPGDLSGRFRLQWDEHNIYFFIEVKDDYKKKIEETADFGWITNAAQDTVWIQTIDICKPAGGHSSNMMVDTSVQLPEGNYVLHYWTNQSHSFGRWTKERPELTFSGIVVY